MKRETIYRVFSDMPTLRTERLRLRKMLVADAEDMFEYACRSDVTKYLTWKPHKTIGYTKQYLEYLGTRYKTGDFYDWAVVLESENKMIGTCGFTKFDPTNNSAEIGYVINPEYRNRGFATEAARAVMDFGFTKLGLHRIEAHYMEGNNTSHHVMEKLGMTFEGMYNSSMFVFGSYRNIGICAAINGNS